MKKFTTAEIRDLLNQVYREEISFSRMVEMINEMVDEKNEPQYKNGDFVIDEVGVIFIFRKKVGDSIYNHAYFYEPLGVVIIAGTPTWPSIKRLATEEEKQKLLDALAKEGKRWNAEKLCVEDIPVHKFKKGDKVRIKEGVSSKTHDNVAPAFVEDMDDLIGKTMIVDRYIDWNNHVKCEGIGWFFHEDWLEPYVEDIPKCKFNVGDKVVLKSGYKKSDKLIYLDVFDLFIGKKITVAGYTDIRSVFFSDCPYIFDEDWLEPYEELKEGDLAIFWDDDKNAAVIGKYGKFTAGQPFPHSNHREHIWKNALKFESKEQFEKLIKGEI